MWSRPKRALKSKNGASAMNGDILLDAHKLINADRQDDYGSPAESLGRISALWSAYLGRAVTGKDVAVLMALLKLSREAHCHKHDNLLDTAGYIGLAADMVEEGRRGERDLPIP
jgi:hypothetical protein